MPGSGNQARGREGGAEEGKPRGVTKSLNSHTLSSVVHPVACMQKKKKKKKVEQFTVPSVVIKVTTKCPLIQGSNRGFKLKERKRVVVNPPSFLLRLLLTPQFKASGTK